MSPILRYIRQRFSPLRFVPLALFLLLYAQGAQAYGYEAFVSVLFVLALLLAFRLFDDLASRKIDAQKPDRIYTEAAHFRSLRNFLLVFSGVTAAVLTLYRPPAGMLLLIFYAVNTAAYYFLFDKWKWRFLLPLLKYPVLCFLLALMSPGADFIAGTHAGACLSLLPVFILFEALDDPDFHIEGWLASLIFALALALLFPALMHSRYLMAAAGVAFLLPLIFFRWIVKFRYASYCTLVYFLTFRLLAEL